jgi:hypothetical protein
MQNGYVQPQHLARYPAAEFRPPVAVVDTRSYLSPMDSQAGPQHQVVDPRNYSSPNPYFERSVHWPPAPAQIISVAAPVYLQQPQRPGRASPPPPRQTIADLSGIHETSLPSTFREVGVIVRGGLPPTGRLSFFSSSCFLYRLGLAPSPS